jgi:hypothetical protein
MRRQRSISFYAETENEYIEEYNKSKSISERRRCRSRSYAHDNDEGSEEPNDNNRRYKKKYFQSLDDLELDQLGVNSTFQIANIENEEPEENENGLIQKIKNINLSFKENNNSSFFTNLAPLTKNIIGTYGSKVKKKVGLERTKSDGYDLNDFLSTDIINSLKKDKKTLEKKDNNNEEEEKEYDDNNENEYINLLGVGPCTYQSKYSGEKNQNEDSNIIKRERNNSIIENIYNNEENNCISFLDNLNINELNKSNSKLFDNENDNDYDYSPNKYNNNDYNNYKIEDNLEKNSPNKDNNLNNNNLSYDINNFENTNNKSDNDNDKNSVNNDKNEDKKMRRYTFDINTFIPNNNYAKEGEENDNQNSIQNKTLQNYISKNEFLSKNIDYVDEHLKFLITGSDIKTKHLFLNQLLNEKSNYEDSNYEQFNILKKVIKLLGDYIKLELYEEDCSLCYSHMLKTYIDVSDGVILIINMDIPSSAQYIYDIIDKLKYKINKDKRHFNTILLCFEIICIDIDKKDLKEEDINKLETKNNDNINKSKEIINNIIKDFELKPSYINFYLNNKEDYLKNEKFELAINKFLSLAYLKKERKRKIYKKKNSKKHKRGITGL